MPSETTTNFVDARIGDLDKLQDQDQATLDRHEATTVEVTDRMTDRAELIAALRLDFPEGG